MLSESFNGANDTYSRAIVG